VKILSDQHYLAQLARFLVIGVVNTIFGLSVFVACILLGVGREISLAIATIIGVLFNFQTMGRLVFRGYRPELIFRFALGYAAVYGLNVLALNCFFKFGIAPIPAQTILTPFFAALTFLINRTFIFRMANEDPPSAS
jgi:putative flippase GtrA